MTDALQQLPGLIASRDWGLFGPQTYALGVDIGSYGLRAVLADLHGARLAHRELEPRPDGNAATVMADILQLVRELLSAEGVRPGHLVRIGVGFSGPVDAARGVTRRSYRVAGWEDLNVCEQFEQAFDAMTLLENDASLIALAEHTFGVGREVRDLYYLHLSTGVGSGLVLNGHLHRGVTTSAGEIGHARVALDGETELEDILSVRGLLRRAGELGLETDDLAALFADGRAGKQAVAELVDRLGVGLAAIVQLLDPALLVLGGIVTRKGGPEFCRAVGERVNRLIAPVPARDIPVVASSLGTDAVAIGGLAMALHSMNE